METPRYPTLGVEIKPTTMATKKTEEKKLDTFHKRLVFVRESTGMTANEFSDKVMKMNRSQYRLIEKGEYGMTPEKMITLHKVLHVNLHWLITGEGDIYLHYTPGKLVPAVKLFIQNWLGKLRNPEPEDTASATQILKALEKIK